MIEQQYNYYTDTAIRKYVLITSFKSSFFEEEIKTSLQKPYNKLIEIIRFLGKWYTIIVLIYFYET